MTKEQELEIMRDTVSRLGSASYCGAWLRDIMPDIEATLRSDIIPTVRLTDTRLECQRIIACANERASELIGIAKKQASEIISAARSNEDSVRTSVANDLKRALELFN